MFPGRFPNVPDTMWNFGWNPQTMGLQGQFCGGDMMNQQLSLKLRLRLRLPLLGSRTRFSINSSLHKLNLTSNIFSNSFPSINLLNRRKPHPLHRLHNHPGLKRPIHQHQWYLKPLKLDLIHPSILKR